MNGTIKIIKIIIIWISVFLFGYVLNNSFNKLEGMTQGKPTSVYDQKVKYTSHDKHIKVTTPGANKLDTDVKKKIDMCDAINSASGGPSCDNLAGTDCGYCLDSDTAMYGDANGPIENVCQAKHWSPPGPNAVSECNKALERRICRGMKDCGDVGGKKSICGWCPSTEEGLVKKLVGSGYDVKYPEVDSCDWRAKPKPAKWLGWGGAQPTPPPQAPAAATATGVTTFTKVGLGGIGTVRPVGTYTAKPKPAAPKPAAPKPAVGCSGRRFDWFQPKDVRRMRKKPGGGEGIFMISNNWSYYGQAYRKLSKSECAKLLRHEACGQGPSKAPWSLFNQLMAGGVITTKNSGLKMVSKANKGMGCIVSGNTLEWNVGCQGGPWSCGGKVTRNNNIEIHSYSGDNKTLGAVTSAAGTYHKIRGWGMYSPGAGHAQTRKNNNRANWNKYNIPREAGDGIP